MRRSSAHQRPTPLRTRAIGAVLRAGLLLAAALLLVAMPRGSLRTGAGHWHVAPGGMAFDQGTLMLSTAPADERWTSPGGSAPPGTAKTHAPDTLGLAKATERQVRTAAVRVAEAQRTVLVALRQCRSLFPSHFFW